VSSIECASARMIAVTSGKGGVGKSNLSVNLAVALARMGERTLLVDCDMGVANAGILMGLNATWTLADLLGRHCALEDIIITGPGGVRLIPGHSGIGIGASLPAGDRRQLMTALSDHAHDYDHIIVDTGAGVGADGLALVAAAGRALIVLAPEPTAFMDAYALVKALSVSHGVASFAVVTNLVDSDAAGRALFDHFESVITRFMHVTLIHAGSIPDDPYVREAVRRKRCCVDAFPSARASKAFTRLALRVAAGDIAATPPSISARGREAVHGAC
jgi:flagellar biosynthesis protein FlhG